MVTRIETMERKDTGRLSYTLENIGANVIRYGLAIIIVAVGALKFTAYESEGVQGFVANSPLMSWVYSLFTVRGFGAALGTVEIIIGLLIATRSFAPKLSAVGSFLAILMFLTTLSFLLTTPGVWQAGYGFPFPSVLPGQFLLKDILLLGAAIWTTGEALRASDIDRVPVQV